MLNYRVFLFTVVAMFLPLSLPQVAKSDVPKGLFEKSLEELKKEKITTIGRKEQSTFTIPQAVSIITPEDIENTGHTSLAELLRLAPGYEVARIGASKWAVSSRGLNEYYARNLLVMLDGRSVYSPFTGGVNWDSQDLVFDNIARVEAVRGPGTTMWGANAGTGVVNVVSKHAKDTQGWYASGGGGNEERGFGDLRYGGKFAKDGYYRADLKFFKQDDTLRLDNGQPSGDAWNMRRGSFQADWKKTKQDNFMLQGSLYSGGGDVWMRNVFNPSGSAAAYFVENRNAEIELDGRHVLARWNRTVSDTNKVQLQAYYDWYRRNEDTIWGESRSTGDLDFQHQVRLGPRHDIIWGAGYRVTSDRNIPSYARWVTPRARTDQLFSLFVQDEIALIPSKLFFTVGSKLEHNDYTGYETQPSSRLAWLVTPNQTVWGAISRSVRVPPRFAHDGWIVGAVGTAPRYRVEYAMSGSRTDSEAIMSYELGHRFKFSDKVSTDFSVFLSMERGVTGLGTMLPSYAATPKPIVPSPLPYYVIPTLNDNGTDVAVYGFEFSGTWQVLPVWRLSTSYAFLRAEANVGKIGRSNDWTWREHIDAYFERRDPENQAQLRSYLELPRNFSLDAAAYYVDYLPDGPLGEHIPGYIRLDLGLGWQPHKNFSVRLVGQNLSDASHPETSGRNEFQDVEIERSGYLKLTYNQ